MTSSTPRLDALLSTDPDDPFEEEIEIETDNSVVIELPPGEIDPRLKLLSYSSSLTLHACPRKYQLYKLDALRNPLADPIKQSVTFAYGHVVGQGCQDVLENRSQEDTYLRAFMMWDCDLEDALPKDRKSFWHALIAIDKFNYLRNNGFLEEYELLYFEGQPACELGFSVELPDGFFFRGFADAVLRHKVTGHIAVVDFKTTKNRNPNSAEYKNSAQAIGYSIILDHIVPDISSYTVLYVVYSSTAGEFTEFPFEKTHLQRALWLRNLLYDKTLIEMYAHGQDQFPCYGNACYDFYRECEYLSLCNMETERLAKPLTQNRLDKMAADQEKYHFHVSFDDLVAAQLEKEI